MILMKLKNRNKMTYLRNLNVNMVTMALTGGRVLKKRKYSLL